MSDSSGLEEFAETYLTAELVIVHPIVTLSAMFLVYGMYIIVFGSCTSILYRRKGPSFGLYMTCTICLFVLASITIGFEVFGEINQTLVGFRALKTRDLEPLVRYMQHDSGQTAWITATGVIPAVMNAIADIMLIHRCYVVWGSNRILLYVLIGGAFVSNGLQFATVIMISVTVDFASMISLYRTARAINNGCSILTAVFNGLLSLATAWRIWWISREARQQMGMPIHAKYKTIVAVILESGALYPASLIVETVVPLTLDPIRAGKVPLDIGILAALFTGLAPTLIIVRVAYGKSVDSVQQMVSIHFAERETQQEANVNPARATVDIRPRSTFAALGANDTELPGRPGEKRREWGDV
ncbi:hypothetical protein PQX77_013903 [Marasmius sp. AFHP31]|nr:hypothetical protein PQX77_013903 [Marasmius sp. AFHP31]